MHVNVYLKKKDFSMTKIKYYDKIDTSNGVEVSGGSTCSELEFRMVLYVGSCTAIGPSEAIIPLQIVHGGENMFDAMPGDVVYRLKRWDQASNTVYTFDLDIIMDGPGCHVNEYDSTLFAESYCQQGSLSYIFYHFDR